MPSRLQAPDTGQEEEPGNAGPAALMPATPLQPATASRTGMQHAKKFGPAPGRPVRALGFPSTCTVNNLFSWETFTCGKRTRKQTA